MVKDSSRPEQPKSSFTVTEASGYDIEDKGQPRTANGWGGTPTQLPQGHLARRDTPANVKHARRTGGAED